MLRENSITPRIFINYEDNCSSNKNNYLLFWAHYLVHKLALFDEIILGFFIVGHTKNECDADFGISKQYQKKFGTDL